MERNYYMVRAMGSSVAEFNEFFANSVVAVGWSEIDFSQEDESTLREKVYDTYYKDATWQPYISQELNRVVRFKNIKKGDYIIVPYPSYIVLAVAEDKELYSDKAYDLDLANQRLVTYRYHDGEILKIPRRNLSEGLQRRISTRGSKVENLYVFKEEIERIFEMESYSYTKHIQNVEEQALARLKVGLLENIQQGKTNLQAGGIGLEKLVCEIMRCEGYDAKIWAKNKFSDAADVDVYAVKEDPFMSKEILIQVKHHSGFTGKTGVDQLIGVLQKDEYKEFDAYLITSAKVSEDVREYAKSNGVKVLDGEALIDLIIENINKLNDDIKYALGISTIPHLLSNK